MANFLMQARDSETGELVSWVSSTPDFDGTDYPGPGDPEDIACKQANAGGSGGEADGSNLGAGVEIFKDTSAGVLRHRTVNVGRSVHLTQNANDIDVEVGRKTTKAVTGNVTLTDTETRSHSIRFTGSPAALSQVTLPTPSAAAETYTRLLQNDTDVILIIKTSASQTLRMPPGTKNVVEVNENGVHAQGETLYDPRHFGARFDDSTDDRSAVQATLDAMPDDVGTVIQLPYGTTRLTSGGLTLRRIGTIAGVGLNSNTLIKVANGFVGIELLRAGQASATDPGASDWSTIRDLQFNALGSTDPTAHGVLVRSHAITLDKVFVIGFGGDGFHFSAGVDVPEAGDLTNANAARLFGCTTMSCKGAGFHFEDGGDINAAVLVGCEAIACEGGDFVDDSFLGNTYVGCGSHSELGPLKVRAFGGSNYTHFDGCYFEGGEHVGIGGTVTAIGGSLAARAISNADNAGPIISGLGCRNISASLVEWSNDDWLPDTVYNLDDVAMPRASVRIVGGKQVLGARQWKVTARTGDFKSGVTDPSWNMSLGGTTATTTDDALTWTEDGPAESTITSTAWLAQDAGSMLFALARTALSHNAHGYFWSDGISGARTGRWAFTYSAGTTQWLFAIPTAANGESHAYTGTDGAIEFKKIKIGTVTNGEVFVDTLDSAPGSGARYRGDTRVNTSATAADPIYAFVCGTAGTPGTWRVLFSHDPAVYGIPPVSTDWWDTTESGANNKARVRSDKARLATTSASADQVVTTIALDDDVVTHIDVVMLVRKVGDPDGATIKLRGAWVRDGGAPVEIVNDAATIDKTGGMHANLDADLNVSSNSVEVRVSPGDTGTGGAGYVISIIDQRVQNT